MRTLVKRALPLAVAFLLGTAMVGTAWAITTYLIKGNLKVTGVVTAKDFRYLKPKTAMLNVPGSAFTIDDPTADDVDHSDYSGLVDLTGDTSDAVAPVNLPQGAIVTKVTVWYVPVTSNGDWELHLEANIAGNDHDDMVVLDAQASCVTDPCKVSTSNVAPNKINNKTRYYGLWLDNETGGAGTVGVYRVQIFYKTPAVGPASSAATTGVVDTPGTDHNGG